jgi:hypothetical protein
MSQAPTHEFVAYTAFGVIVTLSVTRFAVGTHQMRCERFRPVSLSGLSVVGGPGLRLTFTIVTAARLTAPG